MSATTITLVVAVACIGSTRSFSHDTAHADIRAASTIPAAADATQDAAIRRWVRYPPAPPGLSAQAELGRLLFFDTALSASRQMSCASCHSPDHAYGPPNGRAVQLGGPDLRHAGARAVPSLRYLDGTPQFSLHAYMPGSEDAEYEGPTGGFTWDGAAASRQQQAAVPLLNPDEMANADPAAVMAAMRRSANASAFIRVFGADSLDDPATALADIGAALAAFQTEDPSFHPYTSKFDAVMSGHARFTPQELHGYALFNDPRKGNCASCHIDRPGPGGRPAAFTDYGYAALGVPRNPAIPANRDPRYYDMGLCGPYRHDLAGQAPYCGMFKTPTLRNTAARQVFFHNGYFHTLSEALHFYVERDTDPRKWYPAAHGKPIAYDDLPPRYRGNVDRSDPPMDRAKGDRPALDALEIDDMTAFLETLDDGYSASAGGPPGYAAGAAADGSREGSGRK
ncbi:cytochrome-c peroxidase [Dyella agri]|uniref:Cytochrome-c peroxidase n=2 Tax=Dyella agri TaxID=1926869 RepID=A0ABW8KDA6_9GAMM